MRSWGDKKRTRARIEIIPMIDVMMFLLVFFVLISINVIPALGLKMKLPASSQARDDHPPVRVVVSVPAEGAFEVDGHSIAGLSELGADLRRRKSASPSGIAVIINGDQAASLQRLVDVMDTLKSNGIEAMTISAKRR